MKTAPLTGWLFALLLAAVTALPYAVGALNTPEGWQYSGAPALPAGAQVDYNSHLAKMWQGQRGQWDYHLLFTHEAHPGLPLVQGFYVALGAVGGLTGQGLPVIYHVARFLLTMLMVIALWRFASRYFQHASERWLALLLASIVGGWSWLLLFLAPSQVADVSPIEFWLLDAFNLLGALTMPHFAAAVILQVVVLLAFESWLDSGRWSSLLTLTVALAAESLIQPYVVLLFGPLLLLWAAYTVLIRKDRALRRAAWLAVPLGLHGLLVLYQFQAINQDPIWSNFSAQNQTLSPPVIFYLLGYLPLLLPALLGIRRLWHDDGHWRLPLLWVVLVALLVYLPLPTQRRYLLGVQTPLAILAAYGWLYVVLPRLRAGYRPILTGVYLLMAAISMVGLLLASVAAVNSPAESGVYDSPDAVQGFAWLRREGGSPDDLVLTTFDARAQGIGGRLVAANGQRVFAGHWIETAYFIQKAYLLHRFYDPETPDVTRQLFLNDIGAVYVWYDEAARAIGDWDPDSADYLEPAFVTDRLTIYRVRLRL